MSTFLGRLPVKPHDGHEEDFAVRSTSTGIALLHCDLDPQGVDVIPRSIGNARLLLVDDIDGSTRYRIDWQEGRLFFEAGPFTERQGDVSVRITCPCGWAGKWRRSTAWRYLVTDQAKHKCPKEAIMVKCSSPTCSATLGILAPRSGDRDLAPWLERLGWALEQQPGDDRPMPYCERDKS